MKQNRYILYISYRFLYNEGILICAHFTDILALSTSCPSFLFYHELPKYTPHWDLIEKHFDGNEKRRNIE